MKLLFIAVAILFLSGCTKCEQDKQPQVDPADNIQEVTPLNDDVDEDEEEQDALERKIETDRSQQDIKRGPVKMDIPGPQHPDEDRD